MGDRDTIIDEIREVRRELSEKIDRIDIAVRGSNGTKGLTTRVAVIEQRQGGIIKGVVLIAGGLITILAKSVHQLFSSS